MNITILKKQLQVWFFIHFIVDIIFALPLLFIPEMILPMFGWVHVDPVFSRLVGAVLFGIGVKSLFTKHDSLDVFRAMLDMKILWAGAAVVGLSISLFFKAPAITWLLLIIFISFLCVWSYYRVLIQKELKKNRTELQ